MVLRTLFEARKGRQGPPHTSKVKQHVPVLSFRISLFIQFFYSVMKTKRVCLFSLFRDNKKKICKF